MLIRETVPNFGKDVARFLRNHGLALATVAHALGRLRERSGRISASVGAYEAAIAALPRVRGRWAFQVYQEWQFNLERARARTGEPRVDDPLFSCEVKPKLGALVGISSRRTAVGYLSFRWCHLGLRVDGVFPRADPGEVRINLDGHTLRSVKVVNRPGIPVYFTFLLKRPTLARFPSTGVLKVTSRQGEPLLYSGATHVELRVPNGDGSIQAWCSAGGRLDKKGCLPPLPQEVKDRQARYLQLYAAARRCFDDLFGIPLFILYGTLLGRCREGDFIEGDDDFDVGYVSLKSDPVSVKRETMDVVVRLVEAGFDVTFNRQGRLFRLKHPEFGRDIHLDVRPVWYQKGTVWAHKQAALPATVEDFLPAQTVWWRGGEVYLPRAPEKFLQAYYGPNWVVPDPSYTNQSQRVPRSVRRNLAKACVTPEDYRELQARVDALPVSENRPGRLVSEGFHSLYPLSDYEAMCDW